MSRLTGAARWPGQAHGGTAGGDGKAQTAQPRTPCGARGKRHGLTSRVQGVITRPVGSAPVADACLGRGKARGPMPLHGYDRGPASSPRHARTTSPLRRRPGGVQGGMASGVRALLAPELP